MNADDLKQLCNQALDEMQCGAELRDIFSPSERQARITLTIPEMSIQQKMALEEELTTRLAQFDVLLTFIFEVVLSQDQVAQTMIQTPSQENPNSKTRRVIPGIKKIIAIGSGKGGVGKSSVTATLAALLATRGVSVGLLDADIYGPSIPFMFGYGDAVKLDKGGKLIPPTLFGFKIMSMGLLTNTQAPALWRGPIAAKALQQLLFDVAWGQLDVLLIDLPPGTGDIHLTLTQDLAIDGAFIVTTPSDIALIDAVKALSMLQKAKVPVFGVIENMSYFQCSQCGSKEHIFGDATADYLKDLNVVARIPLHRGMIEGFHQGRPAALDDIQLEQYFAPVLQALYGETQS